MEFLKNTAKVNLEGFLFSAQIFSVAPFAKERCCEKARAEKHLRTWTGEVEHAEPKITKV